MRVFLQCFGCLCLPQLQGAIQLRVDCHESNRRTLVQYFQPTQQRSALEKQWVSTFLTSNCQSYTALAH